MGINEFAMCTIWVLMKNDRPVSAGPTPREASRDVPDGWKKLSTVPRWVNDEEPMGVYWLEEIDWHRS